MYHWYVNENICEIGGWHLAHLWNLEMAPFHTVYVNHNTCEISRRPLATLHTTGNWIKIPVKKVDRTWSHYATLYVNQNTCEISRWHLVHTMYHWYMNQSTCEISLWPMATLYTTGNWIKTHWKSRRPPVTLRNTGMWIKTPVNK